MIQREKPNQAKYRWKRLFRRARFILIYAYQYHVRQAHKRGLRFFRKPFFPTDIDQPTSHFY